ncbi:hypothetical protein [Sansalvadorimonas verongulae]|uniref:hypothetical protein n=1 Tax=Sansalvadorimonas verongulae TaxID=2172824 RepID=UPI0012BB5086|nr:hypothetical protein [Sansalvadorimonas verongulae]MTI14474.1 hypothetical protein [Sansalvadorimonas verongulae]
MKNLLIAALLLSLTGCASIVSKSDYPVRITASEKNVNYTIKDENGVEVATGQTPDVVTLPAYDGFFDGQTYTVKAEKGDKKGAEILDSKIDGWYLGGNIFVGGLIGWFIVDPATGAMWRLPDNVHVNMK